MLWRLYQLLLLVLSVQLGGWGDAWAFSGAPSCEERGCCSDCPLESRGDTSHSELDRSLRSGLGCPPGCRLCHCHQAGAVRLPDVDRPLLLLPAGEAGTEHSWSALAAPRSPFSSALYRPPRVLALPV